MGTTLAQTGARRRHGGFTLLEMLVALTVLGFLVVGLNEGVHTGLRFWESQDRRIGRTAELDAAARVLRGLLKEIPIIPAASATVGSPAIAIAFTGKVDHVTFVGDLPTGLGGTQRAEITLTVSGGNLVLLWSPHRHDLTNAQSAPNRTELMHGVARLQLAYWGAGSSNAPAGWHAQWDGPALPRLIRVRLGFADADRRIWPDMIVAPQLSMPGA